MELENKIIREEFEHNVNYDEYDKKMNALAEKDDEKYENSLEEEF